MSDEPTPIAVIPVAPYQRHPDDPAALLIACPVCPAPIGAWCGGKDDVHEERTKAAAAQGVSV